MRKWRYKEVISLDLLFILCCTTLSRNSHQHGNLGFDIFPDIPLSFLLQHQMGNVAGWDPRQLREKAPNPKSWFSRNKQCFLFPYRVFPYCIRGVILFMGDSFPKNPKFGEMVEWMELVSIHTTLSWWRLYQESLGEGPLKANNKELCGHFNQEWV